MTDFSWLLDHLKKERQRPKAPGEVRKRLQDIGIIDEHGDLAEHYMTKKQIREKRDRRKVD